MLGLLLFILLFFFNPSCFKRIVVADMYHPVLIEPGVRFSKDPKTLRPRKAIRKTPTRLFCEAGLFKCCKGNTNSSNCKASWHRTPSLWRYKENYVTRKISGLSRNGLMVLVPRWHNTIQRISITKIYWVMQWIVLCPTGTSLSFA